MTSKSHGTPKKRPSSRAKRKRRTRRTRQNAPFQPIMADDERMTAFNQAGTGKKGMPTMAERPEWEQDALSRLRRLNSQEY